MMPHSTSSPLPPGTVVGERFTIRCLLGQGGMASVYEAYDLRLRQRVAIKVLSSAFASDEGAVERFFREARAVVLLRNQHVVRVLDVGSVPDGAPYLAMEFLGGQSLAALLASSGPLPPNEVVEYTLQTLEALAEAHRAGIVHRDLKPENLMLVDGEDDLPQIKVIDFGISKLVGPEFTLKNLTLDSAFLGSPLYASPEQLSDAARVDARTDFWSLGVVMYELLVGEPPFNARSVSALMVAICSEQPRPLDALRPDVPRGLADVVARCLSKDVAQRFGSAQELARALAPFAPGSQGRMSVARILRVQSSAPPRVLGEHARTLTTLPPAWTSATMIPPPPQIEPRRRPRALRIAILAASTVALVSLAFALWPRERRGPSIPITVGEQRGSERPRVGPAAPSPSPSLGPHSNVSPLTEPTISLQPPPPLPSALGSPGSLRNHGGRTPATAASLAARASPQGNAARAEPTEARAIPEPRAAPTDTWPAPASPVPSAAPRSVRPLDTANPFARDSR